MEKKVKQRILSYIVLGALCFIIPFLNIGTMVLATGTREMGMFYGVVFAPIIIHFIYVMIFVKSDLKLKEIWRYVLPLITASISLIVSVSLFLLISNFYFSQGLFGSYGIWDLIILYFLTGIIIWEITYRILRKLYGKKENT